jgi:hypothetical protein
VLDDVLDRRNHQPVTRQHRYRYWLGRLMLINNGIRHGGGPMRFEGGPNAYTSNVQTQPAQTPAGYFNFNHGEATASSVASAFGNPSGARHPATWNMGEVGGAIKSYKRTDIAINATSSGELGYPATGSTTFTIDATATGGLIVGATGTATITINGTAAIVATLNTTGTATISIDGNAALGAIASLTGTGTIGIEGHAAIMGIGYMTGTTVESGLTPTGIANAVLNSLLAQYTADGTVGKALGLASSGGVDYDTLALAVRAELAVELARLLDLAKINGLVAGTDAVVTASSRLAGDVAQTITEAAGTVTVSRA